MDTIQAQWATALQHLQARQPFQAEQILRVILAQMPTNAQVMQTLAQACYEQGKPLESIAVLTEALTTNPGNTDLRFSLAAILAQLGRWHEAIGHYQAILQLSPDHETTLVNLGVAHYAHFQFNAATECFEKALQLNPGNIMARYNLGLTQMRLGKSIEADANFRAVLTAAPAYGEAQSCLLYNLHNLPDSTEQAIFEAHAEWGRQHLTPETIQSQGPMRAPADRPIRVGYVSPDFRRHSVAYFIAPVLEAHDRRKVEIFCYSNVAIPDEVTTRISLLADHWRDIARLSDEQAAAAIREDGIDILVDLSGHTGGNRLQVFTRKPAPIQATWIGYPGTTGLPAMDYRITDGRADPEGRADHYHSERLVRLESCFLCYQPPTEAPAVGPLHASRSGHVTFGSFNNLSKFTSGTIELWSRLLREIPDARLLIKAQARGGEHSYDDLRSAFRNQSVDPQRIAFMGFLQETRDHLDQYNQVDIALDTFPYNGTTTTCESLWMGVPVITLRGHRHASRVGASLLHAAGLPEFIADTEEGYLTIAAQMARDLGQLTTLRERLRPIVAGSSLTSRDKLARELEEAYRKMLDTASIY